MPNGKYNYTVSLQDVDFTKKIRLPRLINYLLETAEQDAEKHNFGLEQLQKNKHSWVLSRLAVEISDYPCSKEPIEIETWVEEYGKFFTTRNFEIKNKYNQTIGSASSIWAMIDMQSRKAINLSELCTSTATGQPSLCKHANKIAPFKANGKDTHKVKYSDIDINGHTNSTKYIEWLLDLIKEPYSFFAKKQITRLDINYLNEAMTNDELCLLYNDEVENKNLFEICREATPICRMGIIFNEKQINKSHYDNK